MFDDMGTDLPTPWDSVEMLKIAEDLRTSSELRDLGYQAWSQCMDYVDGKLEIIDEGLFLAAQEFFAKAVEVERMNLY